MDAEGGAWLQSGRCPQVPPLSLPYPAWVLSRRGDLRTRERTPHTQTEEPPFFFSFTLDTEQGETHRKPKISFLLLLALHHQKCITSFFFFFFCFLAVWCVSNWEVGCCSFPSALLCVCLYAQLYPPVGTLELSPSRHIVVTT